VNGPERCSGLVLPNILIMLYYCKSAWHNPQSNPQTKLPSRRQLTGAPASAVRAVFGAGPFPSRQGLVVPFDFGTGPFLTSHPYLSPSVLVYRH
jgi:hypothetical protein